MCRVCIQLLLLLCVSSAAFAQEPSKEEAAAIQLMQDGKNDEALAAFANIVKANPKNANAIGAMSELYAGKGDFRAAYNTATDGLKSAPDAAFLAISAATAALKMDKPDDALRLMDAVIIKYPAQDYAHYVRGKALDAKGRIQQAIGAYSKSLQLKADAPEALYSRGADFYAISRYADALKDFDRLLALDPTWTIGYNMRGLTNYHLGNIEAAIGDYTKCAALQPKSAIPLANRGNIYIERKQTSLAKADFEKAIALEPAYAEGYYGLAKAYDAEQAYAQALPMIEKAVVLNPNMPPYLAVYAMTLISLDREQEAIPIADKILAIDDKNTDGYLYKATAQKNRKDFGAALNTVTTGINKVPDNYLLYGLRASIYRDQGNKAAANADDAKARVLATK